MAREIGRLDSYGLGIETTSGTSAVASVFIPLETGKLRPINKTIKDTSGRGVIDSMVDANVAEQTSEFTGAGVVRSQSIGYLLLMALGQVASPSLVETGVYAHAFTRKNTNQHPSATLYAKEGTGDKKSTYSMIDTLAMKASVGDYLRFDVKMMGQKLVDGSTITPAYISADETFLVSKMYVKEATNLAGLAAASRIGVKSFNFEIAKNLEMAFETRTGSVVDATTFTSQENGAFMVTGDVERIVDNDTARDESTAASLRAIEVTVEGKTLIGATKYNTLTFRFMQTVKEDWDRSDSNDDIVTQTYGFTALYSLADSATMDATLTNTRSTIYA